MFNIVDRNEKIIATTPTLSMAEETKAVILHAQGQVIGRIGRANKRARGERRGLPKGLLLGLTIVPLNQQD